MAKVQIKSEKLTPFGGFFSIMKQFDALLAQTIDSTLGLRCTMFERKRLRVYTLHNSKKAVTAD